MRMRRVRHGDNRGRQRPQRGGAGCSLRFRGDGVRTRGLAPTLVWRVIGNVFSRCLCPHHYTLRATVLWIEAVGAGCRSPKGLDRVREGEGEGEGEGEDIGDCCAVGAGFGRPEGGRVCGRAGLRRDGGLANVGEMRIGAVGQRWFARGAAVCVAGVVFAGCAVLRDWSRVVPEDPAAAIDRAMPTIRLADGSVLDLGLADWMEHLAVPGVSLAVIDNYEVVWTQGFGVAEAGSDRPVTPETLFQAASISKPVAALMTMLLVESGKLDLDVSVNELLTEWTLPADDPEIDRAPTLRELLSHTGGLPRGGFAGYDPGADIPDLRQMLDAVPPATNPAARIVRPPGEAFVYGGMGYMVVQQVLTEHTGKDFAELTEERIFRPLGMRNSTFAQPLPPARAEAAASGHNAVGQVLPGRWRVQPGQAAAGLWTTPTDAAVIAIETAKARRGRPTKLVSRTVAEWMLTPHRGHVALGWMRPMAAPGGLFVHSGANNGYRAYLLMHADTGQGLAVMTNADSGGKLLIPIIAAVAEAFRWPARPPRPLAPGTRLQLVDAVHGAEKALEDYIEQRRRRPAAVSPEDLHNWANRMLFNERFDDALLAFRENAKLYPESEYAHLHLARCYLAVGKTEDALQSLERALDLAPGLEPALRLRARLNASGGGPDP